MNKAELISMVSEESGLSKADATKAVKAVIDAIGSTLAKGETVSLIGFGSFLVRERAARVGHNPKTGEKLQIPASKQPAFKPGRTLKDLVS